MSGLVGIWGRPFIDLAPYFDLSGFPALDREICLALAKAKSLTSTGASLKWMGVVAPWVMDDGYVDYNVAIEEFTREEFVDLVSLADDPGVFDLERFADYRFGDETQHPLNAAQMRWLRFRHGVYFPWKIVFELLSEFTWDDKNSGVGKRFNDEALALMPKTIAFIRSLPFKEIGRCLVFGLDPNDHAPAHRDTEPNSKPIDHCISFAPAGGKQLYLTDPERETHVRVDSKIYWFNDMDYHGVDPAKTFQYSVRIDGVFQDEFLARLTHDHAR